VAQVRTNISTNIAPRNHSAEVCKSRGKSVALALDMTSGGDALSTWMVRPGSTVTTVIRCDLPQYVVIITAAAEGTSPTPQNNEVVAMYNRIGGN
jgi:phosphoribosylformimino-5-aminoimidazole carboxamide ribonucleotide (ProFAR) isomerase